MMNLREKYSTIEIATGKCLITHFRVHAPSILIGPQLLLCIFGFKGPTAAKLVGGGGGVQVKICGWLAHLHQRKHVVSLHPP